MCALTSSRLGDFSDTVTVMITIIFFFLGAGGGGLGIRGEDSSPQIP